MRWIQAAGSASFPRVNVRNVVVPVKWCKKGEPMTKHELVLELSLDGGGMTIYRTPAAIGGWQFHIGGSTIDLDENDSEVWRSWQTELFTSLEEALLSVTKDSSWVTF